MKIFLLIVFLSFQLLSQEIVLDKNEKDLIESNKYKVGVTGTWPPFNFLDNKSNIRGISIDYWNLIRKKIGIKSSMEKDKSFSNVLSKIKTEDYDLTINTTDTRARDEYAVFSKEYELFPIAIVTKNKKDFIPKTSLLNGKKVAVGKNYSAYYLLKEKYPLISFVIVGNTKEALSLVENGEVFAAIDILPSLQYHIFNLESNDLKINGITDINFKLKIMLNKNHKNLIPIINKAIDAITVEERNEIYTKWLLNPNIEKLNLNSIYKVGSLLLFIVLIFIYWNVNLQKIKKKLLEEKNKLNEILSKLPVPILIVDNKTKKILFANHFATVLYRTSYDNLFNKSIDILYTSKTQREDILNEMDKSGALINLESSFKLMDGKIIDGLLSFIPLKYENRACRIGVVTDITELKTTQKELKLLNENLEEKVNFAIDKNKEQQMFLFQQSRLAQMGEMISMIAHQWRQPLNILSLIVQTIENDYKKDKLNKNLLDELVTESFTQINLMSRIIDDFMTFFRPDKEIEVFNVNKQIEISIGLLSKLVVDNNIKLEVSLCDDINVLGYQNEFGQVIINLITNAKDAIQENYIKNGKIKIESKVIANEIIITVKDNAKGINSLDIDKIFNPYFSTKLEKNGTGLGLYMSKLIIEDHMKGIISAKNLFDGACFQIELKIFKDK